MVISQPRNHPSYCPRPSTNAASITLNASRDTLCSIHAITTSRVTHRNGAIKHSFAQSDHGGIISRLFFIHFVAPCACSSLAVKMLLQIMAEIWHVDFLPSVGCISPQNANRTALCYATNTIK